MPPKRKLLTPAEDLGLVFPKTKLARTGPPSAGKAGAGRRGLLLVQSVNPSYSPSKDPANKKGLHGVGARAASPTAAAKKPTTVDSCLNDCTRALLDVPLPDSYSVLLSIYGALQNYQQLSRSRGGQKCAWAATQPALERAAGRRVTMKQLSHIKALCPELLQLDWERPSAGGGPGHPGGASTPGGGKAGGSEPHLVLSVPVVAAASAGCGSLLPGQTAADDGAAVDDVAGLGKQRSIEYNRTLLQAALAVHLVRHHPDCTAALQAAGREPQQQQRHQRDEGDASAQSEAAAGPSGGGGDGGGGASAAALPPLTPRRVEAAADALRLMLAAHEGKWPVGVPDLPHVPIARPSAASSAGGGGSAANSPATPASAISRRLSLGQASSAARPPLGLQSRRRRLSFGGGQPVSPAVARLAASSPAAAALATRLSPLPEASGGAAGGVAEGAGDGGIAPGGLSSGPGPARQQPDALAAAGGEGGAGNDGDDDEAMFASLPAELRRRSMDGTLPVSLSALKAIRQREEQMHQLSNPAAVAARRQSQTTGSLPGAFDRLRSFFGSSGPCVKPLDEVVSAMAAADRNGCPPEEVERQLRALGEHIPEYMSIERREARAGAGSSSSSVAPEGTQEEIVRVRRGAAVTQLRQRLALMAAKRRLSLG